MSRRMTFTLTLVFLLACMLLLAQLAIATTVIWTAKASMPTARTWISAAVYAGKIYVFGGLSSTTKLATVERYDPETNTWESRMPMPTARYGTSAVTLNGLIYVLGGVNSSNQIQSIVEVYDPVDDTWSTAASMPTARTRLSAVVLEGKIYAIGGSTTSTMDLVGYTSKVEMYDPGTNSWSTGVPMNTPRVGLAAAASGGKIYAFGGYGTPPGYTARYLITVEVYDPDGGSWSSAPSMKTARYGLAAATSSQGLIYLIGGKNESVVLPSSNEEYIPSLGESSYIAGLPSGQRSELAAVSLNDQGDDILYAMGGGNMWTPMDDLEAGALSDLPDITPTPTPVTYPPSAITDLSASASCASGSILLSWSAPGGNGDLGTAASYEVRYSTQPIISQSAWDAATPVSTGIPDPLRSGTRQSMTVAGFNPGDLRYFAVRARNAHLEIGDLSNPASAQATSGSAGKPWTIMIYAAGDNNLHSYIHQDISSIELAAHNTCLNLVLLWDGAALNDSAYYKLRFDPHMSTWAAYTQGVDKWTMAELNMGDPVNLTAFVDWAKTNYPAAQYALVIRDHGDGLGGMEQDDRSDDYLTIPELDQALDTITAGGADPLDLAFMDACLMGMIEDAYQFRGQIGVYVASENVTWSSLGSNSHHDYFYAVSPSTTPVQMGDMIINGYADWMETRLASYCYTISAVNLAAIDGVVTSANNLAASLNDGMSTYSTQIRDARLATRHYWWSAYIDLYDFAENIYAYIPDAAIRADASALQTAVSSYVLAERHSSPSQDGSHGVSVFFPTDSSSFYDPANYDFAVGASWPAAPRPPELAFVQNTVGWGTLLTSYIQTFPGGPDVSEPPLPVSPQVPSEIFIPILIKTQ